MTYHRLINIALAALIALVLASSYLLDGPSVWATAQAMADDAKAAQHQAAEQDKATRSRTRFEQAAQDMCGPNAGWQDVGNGVVQCLTKHGRKLAKHTVIALAGD